MAALGGILAHLFYRWSLGLALATVMALAAGIWSTGTSLDASEIRGALSDLPALVGVGETSPSLPDQPGNLMHFLEKVQRQVMQVWETVTARPEAQKHLLITMLAGAAIGLFAGLVLGRLAAILWTSVLAAGGLLFAGIYLAVWYQPQWGDYLSNNRQYVLMAGAAAALLFMLRQLARGRPATVVVVEAPAEWPHPQTNRRVIPAVMHLTETPGLAWPLCPVSTLRQGGVERACMEESFHSTGDLDRSVAGGLRTGGQASSSC